MSARNTQGSVWTGRSVDPYSRAKKGTLTNYLKAPLFHIQWGARAATPEQYTAPLFSDQNIKFILEPLIE